MDLYNGVIYDVMGEWVYERNGNKLIFDISSSIVFAKNGHSMKSIIYCIVYIGMFSNIQNTKEYHIF